MSCHRVAALALAGCQFSPGASSARGASDGGEIADTHRPADGATSFLIEAEQFSASTATSTHAWTALTDVAGYSGTAFMQILPADGMSCDLTMLATCGTSLDFDLQIVAPATYNVYVRMWAATTSEDSVWYGLDGMAQMAPLQPPHDSTWYWMPGASFPLVAGPHSLTLWQREAGARVDAVAVTTSATAP